MTTKLNYYGNKNEALKVMGYMMMGGLLVIFGVIIGMELSGCVGVQIPV